MLFLPRTNNNISVENNAKRNQDEKTLKASRDSWGNEGVRILAKDRLILDSYFRDNSIIFSCEFLL